MTARWPDKTSRRVQLWRLVYFYPRIGDAITVATRAWDLVQLVGARQAAVAPARSASFYVPAMPVRTPILSRPLPVLIAGAVCLTILATLADSVAYTHLSYPAVYQQNLGRLMRVAGWLPFWLLAAAALYRVTRSPAGKRHALLLMAAPTLSGALSETIKLLVRRERPTAAAGEYLFRAFLDHPFDTGRFGMPSGDATVAFAAAMILTRVWPEARLVWFGLAVGCALGRVLSRAHFLSDVTVAALLGITVAEWLWRRYGSTTSTLPLPTAT